LAEELLRFPQRCLLSDRRSTYEQWELPFEQAIQNEFRLGMSTIQSGETVEGAGRFSKGVGRHGSFEET
jgi:enoyl-CoA hydratase